MTVTTESGRQLTLLAHHQVFWPTDRRIRPGQVIDPETVDVDCDRAGTLRKGDRIIVDNRVEAVAEVVTA